MKKFITLFIVVLMSFSLCVIPAKAASDIKLIYSGAQVSLDTPPIIKDGRVLVPIRAIGDILGVSVIWIPEDRSVFYFNNEGVAYLLKIDSNVVEVGRAAGIEPTYVTIDVPPTIINGRTHVPIRFLAESFGIKVDWDSNNNAVIIGNQGVKVTESGIDYILDAVPGTGEYTGWYQLKGYSGEDILSVYFKYATDGDNTIHFETKYLGKYNFDKNVTWRDQLGLIHVTTIGELFNIQSQIGGNAIAKIKQEYGDMYTAWIKKESINFFYYVEKYLIGIGAREKYVSPWEGFPKSTEPLDWVEVPTKASAEADIDAYRREIFYEWAELHANAGKNGYFIDEWLNINDMPSFGLVCEKARFEHNTWEFYKNSKVVFRYTFPSSWGNGDVVTFDGIRAKLTNSGLVFNINDLVKSGLIEESKVQVLPNDDDYVNEKVRKYIEENYPELNADDYIIP